MTFNNKVLAFFISIILLSGCTVSNTTTNTFDKKGRAKTITKLKISKNIKVLKGIGTIVATIIMGKSENGILIATALLNHDIANKNYILQREISKDRKTKIPDEKI